VVTSLRQRGSPGVQRHARRGRGDELQARAGLVGELRVQIGRGEGLGARLLQPADGDQQPGSHGSEHRLLPWRRVDQSTLGVRPRLVPPAESEQGVGAGREHGRPQCHVVGETGGLVQQVQRLIGMHRGGQVHQRRSALGRAVGRLVGLAQHGFRTRRVTFPDQPDALVVQVLPRHLRPASRSVSVAVGEPARDRA
jgi:hypothetical protein